MLHNERTCVGDKVNRGPVACRADGSHAEQIWDHDSRGKRQHAARRQAFIAVRAISRLAGGRSLYIPQGHHLERALRDRALWELYDGNNIDELVSRAGISAVQVYNIIAEQRKLARARHQSDLFNEPANG